MKFSELEKIDAEHIAQMILEKLGIEYDRNRVQYLSKSKVPQLESVISQIESIEKDWEYSPTNNTHSFGRKDAGETIRLWSVPKKSAEVLRDLVVLTCAKNIVEVGTSAGYAALHLADGATLNRGHVYTVELLREKIDLAQSNFQKSGLNNISLLEGEAATILQNWDKDKIDFVFLDADKENYGKYLDLLLPNIKLNGIIVADNINDYGHMMEDYLQRVTGTHLPKSRTDQRVKSYYLAALDNGLMITKKISD